MTVWRGTDVYKGEARKGRGGVTLIEMVITVGIISVLLAMALLLAKHVEAITKIRRAQAELAEWHEALNRWFVQFGEYPCFRLLNTGDERADSTTRCVKYGSANTISNLIWVASNACVNVGGNDVVYFSQYIVGSPNTIDPWGVPYLYIPEDDDPEDSIVNPRSTYYLLSCGPDGKSPAKGDDDKTENDDVYFGQ